MEVTNNNTQMRQMMNELIQGRDLAKHLQSSSSSLESTTTTTTTQESIMIQRIIDSFERSIDILKSDPSYSLTAATQFPADSPHSAFSGSPKSQEDSDGDYFFKDPDPSRSGGSDQQQLHDPRKRKIIYPVEKRRVPGCSDSGLEGPIEDGFSWRKYGQKDILAANYPRAYYRCTFRQGQGCLATKQVQRNDDDPTLFDVAYRGKHTCSQASSSSSLHNPTDIKPEPSEVLAYTHPNQSQGVIWSFGSEPKDIKPIITNNKLKHLSSTSFSFQYSPPNPTPVSDHQSHTSFPYNTNNQLSNNCSFSTNISSSDQQYGVSLQTEVVPAIASDPSAMAMAMAPRFSFDHGEFDQHDIMFESPEFF